jgi:hypothetical protein
MASGAPARPRRLICITSDRRQLSLRPVATSGTSVVETRFKPAQTPEGRDECRRTEMMTDHELTEMVLRVMRQQLKEKMAAARLRPTPDGMPAPFGCHPAGGDFS